MRLYGRLRSPFVAFIHDLFMVPMAWFAAYWLRFNFSVIPAEYLTQAWLWLPLLVMTQAGAFVYFGLYRGDWRFASMPDLLRIIKAVSVGTLICLAAHFPADTPEHHPQSGISRLLVAVDRRPGNPAVFLSLAQGPEVLSRNRTTRTHRRRRPRRGNAGPGPAA